MTRRGGLIHSNKTAALRSVLVDGFRFAALLCFLISLLSAAADCKTLPPVGVSTGTIHVPKLQKLTVAVYTDVATIDATVLDGWMRAGTTALQKKDSPADVACPVKLVRDGDVGSFDDSSGYDFHLIDTIGAYNALRTDVTQRIKVVPRITVCGTQTIATSFNACSDQATAPATVSHMVLASSSSINNITLTHEFGHNVGNPDLGCTGCPVGSTSRIMYFQGVAGKNEVSADECKNYQR